MQTVRQVRRRRGGRSGGVCEGGSGRGAGTEHGDRICRAGGDRRAAGGAFQENQQAQAEGTRTAQRIRQPVQKTRAQVQKDRLQMERRRTGAS